MIQSQQTPRQRFGCTGAKARQATLNTQSCQRIVNVLLLTSGAGPCKTLLRDDGCFLTLAQLTMPGLSVET